MLCLKNFNASSSENSFHFLIILAVTKQIFSGNLPVSNFKPTDVNIHTSQRASQRATKKLWEGNRKDLDTKRITAKEN